MSTVTIDIIAETRKLSSGINEANSKLGKFGSGVSKIGGLLAGAFAGVQVINGIKSVIGAASDLNETVSKTQTIFGKASPSIMKFGEGAATSLGLSENAALGAVSTFGNFFNQVGIGVKQSAALSKSFVRMSSDLASFNNADPSEVADAFASATRGEYDALQRFIPTINAARVEQEALIKTGKTSADELTDQDKAIALHTLAVKGMGKAQGDFQRTSGSLANQQRILSAEFENVKAKIGQALLPVAIKLATFLTENMIPAFEAVGRFLGPIIAKFKQFFSSLQGGSGDVNGVVSAFQKFASVVIPIIVQVAQTLIQQWTAIKPDVLDIWRSVKEIVVSYMSIVRTYISVVTKVIQAIWQKFGGNILQFIGSTLRNIVTVIRGGFKVIAGIFKVISSLLKGDWKGVWEGLKQIASGAMLVIKGLFSQFGATIRFVFQVLIGAMRSIATAIWNGVKSAFVNGISNAIQLVRELPGKIVAAVGDLSQLLFNAGVDLIQGFIDGIGSMVDSVKGKLGDLTGSLTSWKGPPSKDKKLLTKSGEWIMQGLIRGFDNGTRGVKDALGSITHLIETYYDKRFKNDKKATRASDALVQSLRDEFKQLGKVAKAHDNITRRLDAAKAKYHQLRGAARDYFQSVRQAVLDASNITDVGKDEAGVQTASSIINGLRAGLKKDIEYRNMLRKLKKAGLSDYQYNQLVAAGVEGGYQTAQALLSGGDKAIKQVNRLTKQISHVASSFARDTTNSMFKAGLNSAEGLIKGLQKKQRALERAGSQIGRAIVKAVNSELDFKPGSGGKGKGNTYNVNVKADATTDKRALGKAIVQAIDAYERSGGRKLAHA